MSLEAIIVFFISITTVIGPTPPGTGVMKLATLLTSENQRHQDKWETERFWGRYYIWFNTLTLGKYEGLLINKFLNFFPFTNTHTKKKTGESSLMSVRPQVHFWLHMHNPSAAIYGLCSGYLWMTHRAWIVVEELLNQKSTYLRWDGYLCSILAFLGLHVQMGAQNMQFWTNFSWFDIVQKDMRIFLWTECCLYLPIYRN